MPKLVLTEPPDFDSDFAVNSVGYWNSSEGIQLRLTMFANQIETGIYNNTLQVSASLYGVLYFIVDGPEPQCIYCQQYFNHVYKNGQFMPEFPAHPNCPHIYDVYLPDFHINSESSEGTWITIRGTHILIKEGETIGQAFKRTTGKNLTGYEEQIYTKRFASEKAAKQNMTPAQRRSENIIKLQEQKEGANTMWNKEEVSTYMSGKNTGAQMYTWKGKKVTHEAYLKHLYAIKPPP